MTEVNKKTILLMGSPNVGKSVFFTHYTKIHVISSNYAGTTVSFMKGDFELAGENVTMIDVPGTYALASSNEAEEIAVGFLEEKPDGILFVLNATDLEGSIKLFFEVARHKIPMVAALNLSDVAKRQGRIFDVTVLEKHLGVPVTTTVAVKGEGFDELEKNMEAVFIQAVPSSPAVNYDHLSTPELWVEAEKIASEVVSFTSQQTNWVDRFGQSFLKPWPGVLYALLVMTASIGIIVGAGKALRALFLLPLVNGIIVPFFESFICGMNLPLVLEKVLIGEFGVFRIGFEWIIALILPYVLLFQLVFSFLEDSGLLPRIAVLFDNLMSKIGVQGGSLIQVMLAFGCAVPAIIGTRTAQTYKERLVVSALICFTIPCISQTGALIALLGDYSVWLLLALLVAGFIIFIITAKILNKLVPGRITPMVIEIPNLLLPEKKSYFRKFNARMRSFLVEAEGPMLLAVLLAALLAETGLLDGISQAVKPLISGWLGLPQEASLALLLGVIRREMSVAPLLAMNLGPLQMFVGAVVSLLYIPCISVFGILAKEFNAKVATLIVLGTVFNAFLIGGLINQVARLIFILV